MSNSEFEDAFCVANTSLERLSILMTLLTQDGARNCLPETLSGDLDFWIADLVTDAQQKFEAVWRAYDGQGEVHHE